MRQHKLNLCHGRHGTCFVFVFSVSVIHYGLHINKICLEFPDHFLVLSRINGSAVESLFSQLKYATGSKLCSVNFSTARMSVLTKANFMKDMLQIVTTEMHLYII